MLTFNIPYKDVYTSEIEFNTQITEMQQGEEQRYPVWTYPKRTFTLKFDKNASGRAELEQFYIETMTQYGGKFYFIWETEKGGNGETYTCWIDMDSLEQTIQEYGFTETSLKFVCIDDKAIEPVESLDFYHKAEANYSIAFNVIKDKLMTANYQLRNLWNRPRKSWTLKFDKNATTRKQIEAFFIAKRGKFRGFNWEWKKEFGGDGNIYNVRFDTDVLNMNIEEYGFSSFEIKLKEVYPILNAQGEYDKDELIPRKLLRIELEGGDINVLDNETLAALSYNGVDYIGSPLEHGDITKDDNQSVNKLEIKVSNIGLGISGIIGNRGNVISNAPAVLTTVLLDINNQIIQDTEAILFAGRCNNLTITNETASMDIETPLGGFEYSCPVMKFRTSCQVRRFKDVRCGYTGSETTCDRTLTRCKELNNSHNFRGFPSIPQETVIKV